MFVVMKKLSKKLLHAVAFSYFYLSISISYADSILEFTSDLTSFLSDHGDFDAEFALIAAITNYTARYESVEAVNTTRTTLEQTKSDLLARGQALGVLQSTLDTITGVDLHETDISNAHDLTMTEYEADTLNGFTPYADMELDNTAYETYVHKWGRIMNGINELSHSFVSDLQTLFSAAVVDNAPYESIDPINCGVNGEIRYFFSAHLTESSPNVDMDIAHSYRYFNKRFSDAPSIDSSDALLYAMEPYVLLGSSLIQMELVTFKVEGLDVTMALRGAGNEVMIATDVDSLENFVTKRQADEIGGITSPPSNNVYIAAPISDELQTHDQRTIDAILNFLPYVGTPQDIDNLVVGFNLITLQNINRVDSAYALAGSVVRIPGSPDTCKFFGRMGTYTSDWMTAYWSGLNGMAQRVLGDAVARINLKRDGYVENPSQLSSYLGFDRVLVKDLPDTSKDIVVSESKFVHKARSYLDVVDLNRRLDDDWVMWTIERMLDPSQGNPIQATGSILEDQKCCLTRKVFTIDDSGNRRWSKVKLNTLISP